jgi:phosphate-selective porin OprO/OprP
MNSVLTFRSFILFLSLFFGIKLGIAQNERDEFPLLNNTNLVSFRKDSLFLMNLRFRMQNRLGMFTEGGEDLTPARFEGFVRRLRLRLDGFVLSRKFAYYIQLSFSRNDMDLNSGLIPHPIRDAMIYYFVHERWYLGFGQSKLPGNRQRVISSGNLNMPERAIANQFLTLDRDFGLFFYGNIPIGNQEIQLKTAITTGDGRNTPGKDEGLAYSFRMEYLPMGSFHDMGDYSEGVTYIEPKPKLSIGFTTHFNHRASRQLGTVGAFLNTPVNLLSGIGDMMFKYGRFALLGEYLYKINTSSSPITGLLPFTGMGLTVQPSVLLGSKTELSLRYSCYLPDKPARSATPEHHQTSIGFGYYFWGHRIKLQTVLGYDVKGGEWRLSSPLNGWNALFQVEFGI